MLLFWSVGLIATKTCERKTEKVTIIVVFTIAISQYQNWIEPHPQCQILLSLQNCRQAPHLCLYREPPPLSHRKAGLPDPTDNDQNQSTVPNILIGIEVQVAITEALALISHVSSTLFRIRQI